MADDPNKFDPSRFPAPKTLGQDDPRITGALNIAANYGDQAEPNALHWVIDQMVRALTGCPVDYLGHYQFEMEPYQYWVAQQELGPGEGPGSWPKGTKPS